MRKMELYRLVVGMVQTNCYIVLNSNSKEAFLVDPGAGTETVKNEIQRLNCTVCGILLTHGHFDHIGAAAELAAFYRISVYMGKEEQELAGDPELNCGSRFGVPCRVEADKLLSDSEQITLAGFSVQTIVTPGHTKGGVCYYLPEETILFSGDTLFLESVGRSDFPTGNEGTLLASIREKLFVLPDETFVYPGHGDKTKIGYEKENNLFFIS